jgi:release factor glutamine methyltransferase
VFHPGFFFSTRLLLRYVASLPLQNKLFLEPGAGSGLISLYAARKGAIVTATDINPAAISFLESNRHINKLQIGIIQSDLFTQIPQQAFDIIAINPPYYKKQPRTAAEYAWYCGERGEYFEHLFKGLHNYIHAQSVVLMVLCDGCDIPMIKNIAAQHGFTLNCVQTKKNWIETNFIFKIEIGSHQSELNHE